MTIAIPKYVPCGRGEPDRTGTYACRVPISGSDLYEYQLLMWDDVIGRWYYLSSDARYRGEILNWVGPLPVGKIVNESVMYAGGYVEGDIEDDKPKSVAMFAGPTPNMDEIMRFAPPRHGKKDAYIFKFNGREDGKPISKWSWERRKWELFRQRDIPHVLNGDQE